MQKFTHFKCPVCGKGYKELGPFGNHMTTEHPGTIPEGWTILQYGYFVNTGKTSGTCRMCKQPTAWNEVTGCYGRMCGSEACKKAYREEFMANMRKRYNKESLLDDPRHREKMLAGRRISGKYPFWDGGEVGYMGALEKAFVKMLNDFFRFPSSDILSPSPNRYLYEYHNPNDLEHEGIHTYIPDFYIPSINLEIEIKSADNRRPGHLVVDVVRDAAKDVRMIKDPTVSYIKIYENDFHVFFQVFADIAQHNVSGSKKPLLVKYISRSLLNSIYTQYIPDDAMAIIKPFIYKYSDRSVLKKSANEAEMPTLVDNPEGLPLIEEADNLPLADVLYGSADDDENEEISPYDSNLGSDDVGINPLIYYGLATQDISDDETSMECEFFNESILESAMEASLSMKDFEENTIDARAAIKYSRWRDKLFGSKNPLSKLSSKMFTKVTVENDRIHVKGINCNLLLYRIKEMYEEGRLKYIFEYEYNAKSLKLFNKKKIGRGDMKIDSVYAPSFFAMELVTMFQDLGERYKDNSYKQIAESIYANTWLAQADQKADIPLLDLTPLKNIRLGLMDHQKRFIQLWPRLKAQLNLRGYILAFKPGKGKTLTSIGLAECVHASKVYIVCPNNLKDNWALEIKKYFAKYDDEKLWMRDVCILGTKYGNPNTAKYIITNNESIGLMSKIAQTDPNAMLIVDECHNFRNIDGLRANELVQLEETIQSQNVLCVSATPIKAVPAEIAPTLQLIDPLFTNEAAKMYAKCFTLNTVNAMHVIEKRFGKIMWRPADDNVELPPKTTKRLKFQLPNESRYYITTVHDEAITLFKELHGEWLAHNKDEIKLFRDSIEKYSMAPKSKTKEYINWVIQSSDSLETGAGAHELSVKEYQAFFDTWIIPNPEAPKDVIDTLRQMEHTLITKAKSHMGKAVGAIYPKRRAEMFIALYEAGKDKIIEMIQNRSKKTVIFSTMVPVINHIAKDLNEMGIGTVTVTGQTKNRLESITQFREDPNTVVIAATSYSLGVGHTFTEASQLFFFGPPWRDTDFEQASDRIHRIGQTDPCDVWNIGLDSKKPNLSDRMEDILQWSSQMFNTAITPTMIDDSVDENGVAIESYADEETTEFLEFMSMAFEHLAPIEEFVKNCPEPAMEAATYSGSRKNPVFILLTVGSTTLAKIIRGATGDTFSHSSIAFNPQLTPLYSFGTKKLTEESRELGFVRATPYDETWGGIKTPFTLFVTYVNDAARRKIESRLEYFMAHADDFKYSFAGLVRNFLHIKSPKKKKWFCSAFVAELLGLGYELRKDATLFRPQQFANLPNVVEIYSGDDIHKYDPMITKRRLEEIKRSKQDDFTGALESAINLNKVYSDSYQLMDVNELDILDRIVRSAQDALESQGLANASDMAVSGGDKVIKHPDAVGLINQVEFQIATAKQLRKNNLECFTFIAGINDPELHISRRGHSDDGLLYIAGTFVPTLNVAFTFGTGNRADSRTLIGYYLCDDIHAGLSYHIIRAYKAHFCETKQQVKPAENPDIYVYQISGSTLDKLPMRSTAAMVWDAAKREGIQIDFKFNRYATDLHRMEVLNYGIFFDRF